MEGNARSENVGLFSWGSSGLYRSLLGRGKDSTGIAVAGRRDISGGVVPPFVEVLETKLIVKGGGTAAIRNAWDEILLATGVSC